MRPLAVSYGWTTLNRTKVHPFVNLQKGGYKMSVAHASILYRTLGVIYDPAVRKSKLALKLDYFPLI